MTSPSVVRTAAALAPAMMLRPVAVQAISQLDFPLIQRIIVVVATTYVLVNVLIDISYRLLDPRIEYE